MKVAYAQIIADYLLRLHGLGPDQWPNQWSVRFNPNLLRTAGQCRRATRTIEISLPHVEVQDDDESGERAVREIVLHEVAHALTTGQHNSDWRWKAIELGASGERQPPSWMRRPPTPYLLRCLVCGCVGPRYAKPWREVLCPSPACQRGEARLAMVVEEVRR